MKAKFVYENINFERGGDPKSALFKEENIKQIKKDMKSSGWNWWDPWGDYQKEHPEDTFRNLNHNLEWAIITDQGKNRKWIPFLVGLGGNLQDVVERKIDFINNLYHPESDHVLAKWEWEKRDKLIQDMIPYGYKPRPKDLKE